MKRVKSEHPFVRRSSFSYLLLGAAALYLILLFFKFPDFLDSISDNGLNGFSFGDDESGRTSKSHVNSLYLDESRRMRINENEHAYLAPRNNGTEEIRNDNSRKKSLNEHYGRITSKTLRRMNRTKNTSPLEIMEEDAWSLGLKAWEALGKYDEKEISMSNVLEKNPESCPSGISMNGEELAKRGDLLVLLPCGLAAGSSITITGTPRHAHKEYARKIVKTGDNDALVSVSQFVVELQGLKSVDGEDPPKILHLNPRLSGDWSYQPVIEHNTCYRMQWGTAQRCNGLPSKNDDMLVDGNLRCEKWIRNDILGTKASKMLSWFDRFIGRPKKPDVTWPFPFREGRMLILTVNAGVEGFHINVGGRHVTSFPYRTGFTLEDATGLAIKGDLDVHSVYATSLPSSHPSFSLNRALEFSEKWKSHFSPQGHVRLFIGVLSASNHFSERMAVRKTWMQSLSVKSSNVAVRFFVALNPRTEVNAILRKEAAYFGDIEILQFMDRYDLVVLKTIAICEYGVRNVRAEYIMKCDDDTFVRVETILKVIEGFSPRSSLYLGNLNLRHRPLRTGKWAVSYEEWLEEIYPPYANGLGYVITSDIANYIISQQANHTLRIFKMEDVSMGMWVEKFNATTKRVTYSHNWKFCQYGCIQDYYTAHYQSPRQMICLWDNLMKGRASCCNF